MATRNVADERMESKRELEAAREELDAVMEKYAAAELAATDGSESAGALLDGRIRRTALSAARRGLEAAYAGDRSDGGAANAPACAACGGPTRYLGREGAPVETALGRVTVPMARHACDACGTSARPREGALDIVGSMTPAARRMASLAGSSCCYAEADRLLVELAEVNFGAERIERTTRSVGADVESRRMGHTVVSLRLGARVACIQKERRRRLGRGDGAMMAKEGGENTMGAASRRPGGCVLFLCCLLMVVGVGRAAADTAEYCNELRALAAEGGADRPDMLYELALCSHWPMPSGPDGRRRADESLISGLKETLALAPDHEPALDFMIHKVRTIGYGHGVDANALAGYATTLYGITGGLGAAETVYEAALDGRDPERAEAIRARVRRDLGLDVLDYGPQRRENSLALACSDGLFRLGLEDFCVSALETLAATAADNGEIIPHDVLGHVGDALRLLRFQALVAGSKEHNDRELLGDRLVGVREMKQGERLRSILDAHPEPLRSSEHYRAHAASAPSWGGRIEALRRAVGIDGGNLKARCELAHALGVTGSLREARTLYADLASAGNQPCEAEAALREIEHAKTRGVLQLKPVSVDDPLTQPY